MNKKLKLGILLFLAGFLGVLSLLTVSFPFPEEALQKFSVEELKLLSLIQPAFLLLIAVITGTILHQKVGLPVPAQTKLMAQIKYGVLLGALACIAVILVNFIFQSFIPQEFIELNDKIKMTPLARLCYGGFTEELLMRFGLMAFAAVSQPTPLFLTYILTGNSIAGITFGWLYWKKGLESACIAHLFFYIILIISSLL